MLNCYLDKEWSHCLSQYNSNWIWQAEDGCRNDSLISLEPMVTYFSWHAGYKGTPHACQSLANQTHPIPDWRVRIFSQVWKGWKAAKQASSEGQDSSNVEAESEAVPGDDVRADDAEGHSDPVWDGQYPADVFTWTLSKRTKQVFLKRLIWMFLLTYHMYKYV